jgi:hypothetical protein
VDLPLHGQGPREGDFYGKLQVASRGELSAKLFHEHIVPRLGRRQVREFGPAELAS